eukprot:GHVP01006198.1.p2 GENE.GHVP01006198.1~~GHVP01006198.1.p2  ORF type:complete len:268 (+),score=70.89 GHVP01006198.1:1609-2412(+)
MVTKQRRVINKRNTNRNEEDSFNTMIKKRKPNVSRDSIMDKKSVPARGKRYFPQKKQKEPSLESLSSSEEQEEDVKENIIQIEKKNTQNKDIKVLEDLVRSMEIEREGILKENKELKEEAMRLVVENKRLISDKEDVLIEKLESSTIEKEKRRESMFSTMEDEKEVTESEALIELYAAVSGVAIHPATDNAWECIYTTRLGEFGFRLRLDQKNSKIHYTPHIAENSESRIVEGLADYLRDELIFGTTQLTKFYHRLFNNLIDIGSKK